MATFTLYLPDELVARLESSRGTESRSAVIRRALAVLLDEGPSANELTPLPEVERSPEPQKDLEPSRGPSQDEGRRALAKPVQPRPIVQKRS